MNGKVISIRPDTIGGDNPVIRTIQDLPGQTFIDGMEPEPEPKQITLFDN
jgi:hypothetical protein